VAVCSLLHCPSAFAGHPLDGALSYGSPDFPLENQAIARCTGNIIAYEIKRTLYSILYNIGSCFNKTEDASSFFGEEKINATVSPIDIPFASPAPYSGIFDET
jgi:hypothetical protein